MRHYRLVGTERTMQIVAHSSLDAGARIKSDPDFYYVGTLERIEDLGGVLVAKVTAKGRIIPVSFRTQKTEGREKKKRDKKEKRALVRERIVKKVFEFGF